MLLYLIGDFTTLFLISNNAYNIFENLTQPGQFDDLHEAPKPVLYNTYTIPPV